MTEHDLIVELLSGNRFVLGTVSRSTLQEIFESLRLAHCPLRSLPASCGTMETTEERGTWSSRTPEGSAALPASR
jgi:hypothetical protein